jgi:hypothetical protein
MQSRVVDFPSSCGNAKTTSMRSSGSSKSSLHASTAGSLVSQNAKSSGFMASRTDSLSTVPQPTSLRRADGAAHNAVSTPGAQAIHGNLYGASVDPLQDEETATNMSATYGRESSTTPAASTMADDSEATKVEEVYATEVVNVQTQKLQEKKRRHILSILGFFSTSMIIGGIVVAAALR